MRNSWIILFFICFYNFQLKAQNDTIYINSFDIKEDGIYKIRFIPSGVDNLYEKEFIGEVLNGVKTGIWVLNFYYKGKFTNKEYILFNTKGLPEKRVQYAYNNEILLEEHILYDKSNIPIVLIEYKYNSFKPNNDFLEGIYISNLENLEDYLNHFWSFWDTEYVKKNRIQKTTFHYYYKGKKGIIEKTTTLYKDAIIIEKFVECYFKNGEKREFIYTKLNSEGKIFYMPSRKIKKYMKKYMGSKSNQSVFRKF